MKDVVSSGLEDGGQSWRRIMFAWDEELVEECKALLANFPLQDLEEDVWQRDINPRGIYLVKKAYELLSKFDLTSDSPLYKICWNNLVPIKVCSMFEDC